MKRNNDDCDACNNYVYRMLEDVLGFLCEVVEMRVNNTVETKNNLKEISENR